MLLIKMLLASVFSTTKIYLMCNLASCQVELRTPHESDHGDAVMEALVNARSGSVLGKGSILKMYFYPGQRTSSRMQIPGAPHVYKV